MARSIPYILAAIAITAQPAAAADKKDAALPQIATCAQSYGSIAIADGDNQGWTQFGLGSPRELLAAIVAESRCFSMHDAASGTPATFLMNAVAGSKEEIDKTVNMAKGAATEGLVRSGALGRMGGGAFGALGMLGGLGGKKKTISVGLRVLSPATGMTVANGTADSVKTSITLGGSGGFGWANGLAGGANQYLSSKEGSQLATAFISAYNAMTAQSAALAAAPKPAPAVPAAVVAVDTQLFSAPDKSAASVRALRAGTTLSPTGNRQGLFVEVKDGFGSQGWISVEELK